MKPAIPHNHMSPYYLRLIVLCHVTSVLLLLSQSTNAAEWSLKPNLTLTGTFSDNIRRATRGNEQSDLVTQINPGLALTSTGPSLTLNTQYTMQNLLYARNAQNNAIRHNLTGNAHTELIKDQFFIDAVTSARQQYTNTLGPQVLNNFNITNNRANVRRFSISPYLKNRFQGWASSEVRYTHGIVTTSAVGLANNQTDTLSLSLDSGHSFTALRWGLRYNKQKSSYGNTLRTINNQTYAANLGYMITPRFLLNATAGYEKSDYLSIGRQPQGSHYSAGFTWSPSQRTSVDASIGRRFFGNSFSLHTRHRSRKTIWNLGYSEDITSTQSQLLMNTGLPAQILPGPANFFTNRIFLQKSLTASSTINGLRNSVSFNLFDSSRTAQTSQTLNLGVLGALNQNLSDQSKQLGGNATWSSHISPNTTTNLTLGYTKNSFPTAGITSDNKNLKFGITGKIQADLGYSISLLHNQYNSNLPNSASKENSFTASMTMQF